MENIAVTTLSSEGQILIPAEIRGKMKVKEKLVILQDGNNFIIKKISDSDKNFEHDLKFAKSTEKALTGYDKGLCVPIMKEEFLKDLKK